MHTTLSGAGAPHMRALRVQALGDALFLPVGWWHAVQALSLSVSVSFTNFRGSNGHYQDYPNYYNRV